MDFKDQYKHPKWQKKRLEILERDKYTCQNCEGTEDQLHVHHKSYKKNHKVWEYENDNFITLCNSCHEEITTMINIGIDEIRNNCISTKSCYEIVEAVHWICKLDIVQLKSLVAKLRGLKLNDRLDQIT